jgi:nucleotide-binding universal stress UspA family protein
VYKRILIPLDGSTTAEQVLPYGRTLARGLKIPIDLLAVIDVRALLTSVSQARIVDRLLLEETHKSDNYLTRVAKQLPGIHVERAVEQGIAAETIVDKAAKDQSSLIAMATHGRSGLNRWLIGSVAEKVLRATTNPLLLVRATPEGRSDGDASLKSLVVPLDGSELAEVALSSATYLAKKLAVEIYLLRAYTNPYGAFAVGAGPYAVNVDQLMAGLRDETRSYLEANMTALRKQGIEEISYLLQEGSAAEEIVAVAKETADSLIVMSSHGRTGVKRWVLGSVAETVVRHASNPVLLLRGGQIAAGSGTCIQEC